MEFVEAIAGDQIRTLPLRTPPVVSAKATAEEAIAEMKAKKLGCAVIADAMQRPLGIFTERSVLKILDEGEDLAHSIVSDFEDPNLLVVRRDQPISLIWDAIVREQFRFICVVNDEGTLVGITGQRGLSEYVSECFPWQVAVQRIGAKPWDQQREGA